MKWCRDAFETLGGVFEPLADEDENMEELVDECLWPSSVFVREALISAHECGFKGFGSQITTDLQHISSGFGVEPIETTHRNINVAARQNVNLKLSRNSRWTACLNSSVAKDNEIKVPKILDSDKVNAKKMMLTNRHYEVAGKAGLFSMGGKVYSQLLEKDFASLMEACPPHFNK